MKIVISVVGRFHAFDLAKQLDKYGYLYKLNTTHPYFSVKRWGIKKNKVNSNIMLELINRYFHRIIGVQAVRKIVYKFQALSNRKYIKDTDVFISWSGASLELIHSSKKQNKKLILERGSSHYSYQMDILSEEYALYGIKHQVDDFVLKRELQEYELADYISIPSTFVKETFLKYGVPEQKLLVNPYGVDLSHFHKIDKNDQVFRIITSGNLSIRKGTRYLLEAFDQLNLKNAEIWHIGSIHEDMKEWLKNYKNPNVHFLGHKPQQELYQYYSQGSIFVLMSLEDGFAMVLTQAMSCGLPIITSTNTGGPDLISEQGKEGYVVPIRDVEKLKQIILELYNDPEKLQRMSESAQKRVEKGFTWDDYGDRYIHNLNKIFKSE
ncbi:glycosyltransferase family 4 protein [Acinetobacter soli]|uniref:glycosyltransferase family 4 protein n=1 Tax=Acinetobacter soli TaxID=487316 RepID=UPI001C471035|nr:glycosyltransferase family 4 protein [Acinetobacter soli]MBV6550772.1 glycosyltransferase family 4 protein [Acinetobacter soli]